MPKGKKVADARRKTILLRIRKNVDNHGMKLHEAIKLENIGRSTYDQWANKLGEDYRPRKYRKSRNGTAATLDVPAHAGPPVTEEESNRPLTPEEQAGESWQSALRYRETLELELEHAAGRIRDLQMLLYDLLTNRMPAPSAEEMAASVVGCTLGAWREYNSR